MNDHKSSRNSHKEKAVTQHESKDQSVAAITDEDKHDYYKELVEEHVHASEESGGNYRTSKEMVCNENRDTMKLVDYGLTNDHEISVEKLLQSGMDMETKLKNDTNISSTMNELEATIGMNHHDLKDSNEDGYLVEILLQR